MPKNTDEFLQHQHSITYQEQMVSGVITGTLGVQGLGKVTALRVTDDPAGGKHGINSLSLLDSGGRALLTLGHLDLPTKYGSTREALSAFVAKYDATLDTIYASDNVITGTRCSDVVKAGELRLTSHGLLGDTNDDGVADFGNHFGTTSKLAGFSSNDLLL